MPERSSWIVNLPHILVQAEFSSNLVGEISTPIKHRQRIQSVGLMVSAKMVYCFKSSNWDWHA